MSGELPPPSLPVPSQKSRKKKEPFTPEEDQKIRDFVAEKGTHCWTDVLELLPGRSTRQCRERWNLYLDPNVCNEPWGPEDEARLLHMYCVFGPKWTLIAKAFPNRTANNVKNKLKQCVRRAQKLAKSGDKRKIVDMLPNGEQAPPVQAVSMPPAPPEQLQSTGELPGTLIQQIPEEQAH